MKLKYDSKRLSEEVKAKRTIFDKIGLREAAREIGISAATLSRIENGKTPDVETMGMICFWLEIPMDNFITAAKKSRRNIIK